MLGRLNHLLVSFSLRLRCDKYAFSARTVLPYFQAVKGFWAGYQGSSKLLGSKDKSAFRTKAVGAALRELEQKVEGQLFRLLDDQMGCHRYRYTY